MNQPQGDMPDPLGAWRSLYGTNLELWAAMMAEVLKTEVVAQTLHARLDEYLASSAPLRQVTEQYLSFWLTQLHLPSRDETNEMTRRLGAIETRLDDLSAQVAAALQPHQEQSSATVPTPAPAAHLEELEQVQARLSDLQAAFQAATATFTEHLPRLTALHELHAQMHALQDRADQTGQALHEQLPQLRSMADSQQIRLNVLEQRIHTLDGKIDQLLQGRQHEQGHPAQPAPAASAHAHASLAERMQALDSKTEHLLHLLQAQALA